MILGYGRKDGKLYVLAGLSAGNLERLQQGDPLQVTRETHGEGCPAELILRIVFGETEDQIHEELVKEGLIRPGTTLKHDYRR